MIEIRTLQHLEVDDIRRLNVGYISPVKYAVKKSESHQQTLISLDLVPLDQPYVKQWETDDEGLARLQRVVTEGLSLGAFNSAQMVGIAIAQAYRWNRSLWVWDFHIARTHQRQGIGKQLMEALADKARQAGLRVMVCETQNTNVPAITFYRRVGYEIDGVDLSYYTNRDMTDFEVAIFMKRKL